MMKSAAYLMIFLAMVLLTLPANAQRRVRPSAETVTIEKAISGFHRLDVSSDFEVTVNFTDGAEGIKVEVNENLAQNVVIEEEAGTLRLKLGGLLNISDWNRRLFLRAEVSAKSLTGIRGRGDVKIRLRDEWNNDDILVKLGGDSQLKGAINAEQLTIDLSGDSKMFLDNEAKSKRVDLRIASDSEFEGAFDTDRLSAELSGDSRVEISGKANRARIIAGGDSKFHNYDFKVKELEIQLKSDSEATVTVTESLGVRASGDSVLEYRGTPSIRTQHVTGDSKVIKR